MSAKTWVTHEIDPENSGNWPSADDCARQLNTSRRTFERSALEAGIPRYKDGRVFRFDPTDLDGLHIESEPNATQDAPTAALLQQAYTHNERLMNLVFELFTTQMGQMRERCSKLEETHTELVKAREDALNQAAEREAIAAMTASEDQRKSEVITKLFDLGKQAVYSKAGAGVAAQFIQSITDEQLATAIMLGEEFWSPEQLAILQKVQQGRTPKETT